MQVKLFYCLFFFFILNCDFLSICISWVVSLYHICFETNVNIHRKKDKRLGLLNILHSKDMCFFPTHLKDLSLPIQNITTTAVPCTGEFEPTSETQSHMIVSSTRHLMVSLWKTPHGNYTPISINALQHFTFKVRKWWGQWSILFVVAIENQFRSGR